MTELAVNRPLDYAQGTYLDDLLPEIIAEVGSDHTFGFMPISPEGTDREGQPYRTTVVPAQSVAELIARGLHKEKLQEILEMDAVGNTPFAVRFGGVRLYSLHMDRTYANDRDIVDHVIASGVNPEKVQYVEKAVFGLKTFTESFVTPATLKRYLNREHITYFRDQLADFERLWVLPNEYADTSPKGDAIKIATVLRREMPAVLFLKAELGPETNLKLPN